MTFIPLSIVLLATLIKDGIEDLRRWSRDKQVNRQKCRIWNKEAQLYKEMTWEDLLVGDFIRIENDEQIPADALLIRTSNESGLCFVETSNLDGESSLKRRCVLSRYKPYSKEGKFSPNIFPHKILCDPPDKSIYNVHAKVEYEFGLYDAITKDSMLLRGSRLRNTEFVEALILYAGMLEMSLALNGSISLTNTSYIVRNAPKPVPAGFLSIGSFIICYQVIVPIALYITIEIIKGLQIRFIEQDIEMYDEITDQPCDCRSLSIPEELGQVTHILSDKTGTLTENEMVARKICFGGISYKFDVPETTNELQKYASKNELYYFLINILVNNSVILHDGKYEADSPDELALVNVLKNFGFTIIAQELDTFTIKFSDDRTIKIWKKLTLAFDSQRKRMSVIIKTDTEDKEQYLLLTKGADSAIMNRLNEPSSSNSITQSTHRNIQNYANEGYRVLCFGMKKLSKTEVESIFQKKNGIETNWSHDRDRLLSELADQVETDFELLGITGIEDKLQEGVRKALQNFRTAGISVWILTGDKLETAENIAHSCGLFDSEMPTMKLEKIEDFENAPKWDQYACNVILAPEALKALSNGEKSCIDFLLEKKRSSVLCYRMTPSEKAAVVAAVKKYTKGTILAIGDGANDVPMLQAADVGIGVIGREGMQAAIASDFAIARFRFLAKLLLVHGHWCYDRLSLTFLYFFYKNTNCTFILFLFQFFDGFSGTMDNDPTFSMIYPIVLTSFQPIIIGVLDQRHRKETLLNNPELYEEGRKGKLYTMWLFFWNVVDGIWQGACVYFITYFALENRFMNLWFFGYYLATGMLLVNIGHLGLEVRYWHIPLVIQFLFFLALHFTYFGLYCQFIQPGWVKDTPTAVFSDAMTHTNFYAVMSIILIVALLPRYLVRAITHSISYKKISQSNELDINEQYSGISDNQNLEK